MNCYVIIGGGGFLGAHLISALQENKVPNKILVVDPSPRLEKFKEIKMNLSEIIFVKASFLDPMVLDAVLKNCEAVFHLCAIGHTGVFGAQKYQDLVYTVNVFGTKQLIEKCKQHQVRRFVYSSSVAVNFVGKPIYNVSEDDPLPPVSEYLDTYSITKAEAEAFILSQSTENFKTSCLRFRAIYGPKDASVAEKVVKMVKRGLLMVRISRHGREAVSNMSAGENCGTALFLADKALQKKSGPHGRAYFITDGETIGQYTVWSPLIKALGKVPPQRSVPYFLVSLFVAVSSFICYELLDIGPPMTRFELEILVNDNTYSNKRAIDELGFRPQKNLFTKTVEYYKAHSKFQSSSSCFNQSFVHTKTFSLILFLLAVIALFFH